MKKSKERLHGKVQETLRDVPLSILMKIILSYAFVWDKEKFVMAGAKIAECIYNYAEDHLDAFNDHNEDDPAEDDDTDLTEQKLANIRQKQYYYKLFAESERRRIVLKTLTKAGAWESSSCRPSSYPSIHALPLLRGEGYSMRGAGGAGPRGWSRLSSRHCFFGLHLLRLTDLTEQRDDICHTDPTDLTEQRDDICHTDPTNLTEQRDDIRHTDLTNLTEQRDDIRHTDPTDLTEQRDDICHTDPTDLTDTESGAKAAKEPKAQKSVRSACVKKSACNTRTICVVEAEKSAVILSEHFPQYLWLASGGLFEMQADKFRPLSGRRVILFPDTDVEGKAFKYWSDMAQLVMRQPFWEDSPPIYVSPILEQQATTEQKERKIDLVDFLFEGVGRS